MCNVRMKREDWTPEDVREGVSRFLQGTGRAHLRAELQTLLDCSRSKADKLCLGEGNNIQAHDLLNINAHFGGELLRALLGYDEDEANRRISEHLEAIRRLTQI